MSKCKHFTLCAVTVAVMSAMYVSVAGATDYENSQYSETGSQEYNDFIVKNSNYIDAESAVSIQGSDSSLTVNGNMNVGVERTTGSSNSLTGVNVDGSAGSLSVGNSLTLNVVDKSNSNGIFVMGLSNSGDVKLGDRSNNITVTNEQGNNTVRGINATDGKITGKNLTVTAKNVASSSLTHVIHLDGGTIDMTNSDSEAQGQLNLFADGMSKVRGLYATKGVLNADILNVNVTGSNASTGIFVCLIDDTESFTLTADKTDLTVFGLIGVGLNLIDERKTSDQTGQTIALGVTQMSIDAGYDTQGIVVSSGNWSLLSSVSGTVHSESGLATGITLHNGDLSVSDEVDLIVTSDAGLAQGINVGFGSATFEKKVNFYTKGEASYTYGVSAANESQVTFKETATFITELVGNADRPFYGVYGASNSSVVFEQGLKATMDGNAGYGNQAVIFAEGATVEVNGGALLKTKDGYMALKSTGGGSITISDTSDSEENKPISQIDGDVYATGAGSTISVGLTGASSYLTGAVNQESSAHVGIALKDGAIWNVAGEDNTVGELSLSSGTLVIEDSATTITVTDLTLIDQTQTIVKLTDAPTSTSGYYLKAVNAVQETGSIRVEGTGDYNDNRTDITADVTKLGMSLLDSDGTSLAQEVYLPENRLYGEVLGTLNDDGKSYTIHERSNSKLDALNSINVLSAMQWKHEINDLNERMGQLRDSPAGIGAWARIYGSEMEHGDQNVLAKNTTLQVGSDVSVGDWKFGIAANYTDGEATYDNGQADTKNYGIALYGSWLAPCGGYVDLIAKYSRLDNDFALRDMKGSYDNNAFSLSAETGYRFTFMDEGFYVEPQVELTYGYVVGDTFTTSNDVTIDQDGYYSFMGRLGVRTGFTFPNKKGTVFAKLSVVHDFAGEMESSATDGNSVGKRKDDLGGTSVEYGVGATFAWTDNTYSYLSLERSSGGDVDERYRFNVGLRHVF